MLYNRERELYNRAFGRFISVHKFDVEHWLSPDDLIEYKNLTNRKEENNV